jgi:chorismate mutase/prephenate dehydratase
VDANELQAELDALDAQIVQLLNRRAALALRSRRDQEESNLPFRPDLDARTMELVAEASAGPLPGASIELIYREILSAERALQRPPRIGYLGPVGTFSYEAAVQQFGHGAVFIPCRTIADIFVETQRQAVDYGVVPVENSTEGAVTPTLDRLVDTDLQISAALELPVRHFLLSRGQLNQITRVYSHPQALAQCRRWLADNLPNASTVETSSTAAAAQQATGPDGAAISTESAAELYHVPIIARRIEDVASNVTRFFVIGPQMSRHSGRDRTAIVFSVEDRTGALYIALKWFAENGINLTRIESRPSRRRLWEYVFFVELEGHPDDEPVSLAITGLRQSSSFVRVLGAWPAQTRHGREGRGTPVAAS